MIKSKYKNKITQVDGIKFSSKKEAKRYGELKLLERAGEITGLERQVRFKLEVNGYKICDYLCDFRYYDWKTKQTVIEDCKGFRTRIYVIKKKLMAAIHKIEIKET